VQTEKLKTSTVHLSLLTVLIRAADNLPRLQAALLLLILLEIGHRRKGSALWLLLHNHDRVARSARENIQVIGEG